MKTPDPDDVRAYHALRDALQRALTAPEDGDAAAAWAEAERLKTAGLAAEARMNGASRRCLIL